MTNKFNVNKARDIFLLFDKLKGIKGKRKPKNKSTSKKNSKQNAISVNEAQQMINRARGDNLPQPMISRIPPNYYGQVPFYNPNQQNNDAIIRYYQGQPVNPLNQQIPFQTGIANPIHKPKLNTNLPEVLPKSVGEKNDIQLNEFVKEIPTTPKSAHEEIDINNILPKEEDEHIKEVPEFPKSLRGQPQIEKREYKVPSNQAFHILGLTKQDKSTSKTKNAETIKNRLKEILPENDVVRLEAERKSTADALFDFIIEKIQHIQDNRILDNSMKTNKQEL